MSIRNVLAGAEPTAITASIESTAANVRQYAFVLPNGDRLVALWTNDVAVEEDLGVRATITFPQASAQSVTGIDVFNGFEQKLITKNENGNLVIRNLLVKDYPLILRFSGASFAEPSIVDSCPVDPVYIPVLPVTIKLMNNGEERIPARTPIQLTTNWVADSQEHVADFPAAATLNGTLDGQPLSNLNNAWGSIAPFWENNSFRLIGYSTQWLYKLGVLNRGTHTLEIWCTLSQPVTDGYDSNNDGQLNMYSGEVWRISMQITVY